MARKQNKKPKKASTEGKVKGRFKTILFVEDDDVDILDDANAIVKLKKVKSALPLMREIFGRALTEYKARLEAKIAKTA